MKFHLFSNYDILIEVLNIKKENGLYNNTYINNNHID